MQLPKSRDDVLVDALIDRLDEIEYKTGMLDVCLETVQDENRFFLRAKMRLAKDLKYWLIQRRGTYNPDFYGKVNEGMIVSLPDHDEIVKQGIEDEVI